ncbi:hypothetical protein [uncultured Treponema sp.]|uniref:hypothetical protein n=1 Tax=uncultured Treponema sp. TaxID=162155 RepID=UPI000E9226F2|nr:hypothetical protein [uncultured Treponema sp.]HAZ95782.1 hypothetical protein [Treponema sp.]
MPYEVLEKQIKALPKEYYDSLVDYLGYLTKKAEEKKLNCSDEKSMQKMRETSLQTVWEELKNDTW